MTEQNKQKPEIRSEEYAVRAFYTIPYNRDFRGPYWDQKMTLKRGTSDYLDTPGWDALYIVDIQDVIGDAPNAEAEWYVEVLLLPDTGDDKVGVDWVDRDSFIKVRDEVGRILWERIWVEEDVSSSGENGTDFLGL